MYIIDDKCLECAEQDNQIYKVISTPIIKISQIIKYSNYRYIFRNNMIVPKKESNYYKTSSFICYCYKNNIIRSSIGSYLQEIHKIPWYRFINISDYSDYSISEEEVLNFINTFCIHIKALFYKLYQNNYNLNLLKYIYKDVDFSNFKKIIFNPNKLIKEEIKNLEYLEFIYDIEYRQCQFFIKSFLDTYNSNVYVIKNSECNCYANIKCKHIKCKHIKYIEYLKKIEKDLFEKIEVAIMLAYKYFNN